MFLFCSWPTIPPPPRLRRTAPRVLRRLRGRGAHGASSRHAAGAGRDRDADGPRRAGRGPRAGRRGRRGRARAALAVRERRPRADLFAHRAGGAPDARPGDPRRRRDREGSVRAAEGSRRVGPRGLPRPPERDPRLCRRGHRGPRRRRGSRRTARSNGCWTTWTSGWRMAVTTTPWPTPRSATWSPASATTSASFPTGPSGTTTPGPSSTCGPATPATSAPTDGGILKRHPPRPGPPDAHGPPPDSG